MATREGSPLRLAAIDSQISRRSFIKKARVVGVSIFAGELLAACSSSEPQRQFGEIDPRLVKPIVTEWSKKAFTLLDSTTNKPGFDNFKNQPTRDASTGNLLMAYQISYTDYSQAAGSANPNDIQRITYGVEFGLKQTDYLRIKNKTISEADIIDQLSKQTAYVSYSITNEDTGKNIQGAALMLNSDGVNWTYTNAKDVFPATTSENQLMQSVSGVLPLEESNLGVFAEVANTVTVDLKQFDKLHASVSSQTSS